MSQSKVSLFIAVMTQIAVGLGLLWFFAVLFGGGEGTAIFQKVNNWTVFAVGALLFGINTIFLRKERNLLFMICLNAGMILAGVWALRRVFSTESVWMTVGLGLILTLSQVSQLRWEAGRFRDQGMALQLQILILLSVCQIWLANQMGIEASQIPVMFFFCLLLLCALVISKISGIQAKKERKASLSRIGITAGVLVAGSTLAAGTAMAVEPVGNFFIGVYGHLRGILAAVVYGFGRIIQFFFTGSKVRLDEQAESSSSSGMETGDSTAGGVEFDLDIFRLFFHIIMIGLAVVLFIGLLRLLLRLTVGSRIRRVAGTKGSGEEQLPLWKTLLKEIRLWFDRTKAKMILRKHPDSIGALIVFLERRCRRNEALCRRPGETLRQFLNRLAVYEKEKEDEGGKEALLSALERLADAADRACYGKNGNILDSFPESQMIRTFSV